MKLYLSTQYLKQKKKKQIAGTIGARVVKKVPIENTTIEKAKNHPTSQNQSSSYRLGWRVNHSLLRLN